MDGGGYPGGGDDDDLVTAAGCAGVFNPDQLLDLHLDLAGGDWASLKADSTNSVYYPATLRCGDGAGIEVAVRRKRSGLGDKPGLKVDINARVPGQTFSGLRKLSLESGIGEGSSTGSVDALVQEYLAWRLMARSGAVTGRAAFARVLVNGELVGVYVNVEQIDKRFLDARLGDDSGWLIKKSGSPNDGQKTREGEPNPYEDYFCFFVRNGGCPVPGAAELAAELPARLDIPQVLRVGAVNALIANTDSPLLKDNNYLYYDYASGPRVYLPWDLDTVMRDDYDVFTGTVPGGVTYFVDALFSNWEADYDAVLEELLAGDLALAAIQGELDRAVDVAGAALDADPLADGDAASAAAGLRAWWTARHADVAAQVAAH